AWFPAVFAPLAATYHQPPGRVAQRESAPLTRERSLVRSQPRPLSARGRPSGRPLADPLSTLSLRVLRLGLLRDALAERVPLVPVRAVEVGERLPAVTGSEVRVAALGAALLSRVLQVPVLLCLARLDLAADALAECVPVVRIRPVELVERQAAVAGREVRVSLLGAALLGGVVDDVVRGLAVLALAVPHRVLALRWISVEPLERLDAHRVKLVGALRGRHLVGSRGRVAGVGKSRADRRDRQRTDGDAADPLHISETSS